MFLTHPRRGHAQIHRRRAPIATTIHQPPAHCTSSSYVPCGALRCFRQSAPCRSFINASAIIFSVQQRGAVTSFSGSSRLNCFLPFVHPRCIKRRTLCGSLSVAPSESSSSATSARPQAGTLIEWSQLTVTGICRHVGLPIASPSLTSPNLSQKLTLVLAQVLIVTQCYFPPRLPSWIVSRTTERGSLSEC